MTLTGGGSQVGDCARIDARNAEGGGLHVNVFVHKGKVTDSCICVKDMCAYSMVAVRVFFECGVM